MLVYCSELYLLSCVVLLDSLASQITVAVLGCVGLLLCFFGHRLFALGLYLLFMLLCIIRLSYSMLCFNLIKVTYNTYLLIFHELLSVIAGPVNSSISQHDECLVLCEASSLQ